MSRLAERLIDLPLTDDLEAAVDAALTTAGGDPRVAIQSLILGQRSPIGGLRRSHQRRLRPPRDRPPMIRERTPDVDAPEIGIQALTFIASHQDLIDKFTDVTGFDPGDLRRLAEQSSFFVAILDFFLAHEPDLLDLASQLHTWSETIGRARNALAKRAGIALEDYAGAT